MAFKRRLVREKVLQALYAYELSGEPVDFVVEHILVGRGIHRRRRSARAHDVGGLTAPQDDRNGHEAPARSHTERS